MNNSRKTSNPRQLEGNGWQQMTQIVNFHETRLNRIDNFIDYFPIVRRSVFSIMTC